MSSVFILSGCQNPNGGGSDDSGSGGSGSGGSGSGGTLSGTLWFFEDMEEHTDKSANPINIPTIDPDDGNTTGGTGGNDYDPGNTGPSSETITKDYIYVHFIDNTNCVFGNVTWKDTLSGGSVVSSTDKKWKPKYKGTYSKTGSNVSFDFTYAGISNACFSDSALWVKTNPSEGVSVPKSYGLYNGTGIGFTVKSKKLSFKYDYLDSNYNAYKIYKWEKQSYTDAAIDGASIDKAVFDAIKEKTFVYNDLEGWEEDCCFTTFKEDAKVYEGTLYENYSDQFKNTYSFRKCNENSAASYWGATGGFVIVVKQTDYSTSLQKVLKYNSESKNLILCDSYGTEYEETDLTYYGSKKIYASELERYAELMINILPEASNYPAVQTTDCNSTNTWNSKKDWCYQNASFLDKINVTGAEPDYNDSLIYKDGKYELTVGGFSYTVDTEKVLPERIWAKKEDDYYYSGPASKPEAWGVKVADNETGKILLKKDEDNPDEITETNADAVLYFYERPTYSVEPKADADLKIIEFRLKAGEDSLEEDVYAGIDETNSKLTVYVPAGEETENALKKVQIGYKLNNDIAVLYFGNKRVADCWPSNPDDYNYGDYNFDDYNFDDYNYDDYYLYGNARMAIASENEPALDLSGTDLKFTVKDDTYSHEYSLVIVRE